MWISGNDSVIDIIVLIFAYFYPLINKMSLFPQAIGEQFRRNGNIYFLCIGLLMFIGYYTPLFYSAISPWTTLGPLAVVVSVSLVQEAYMDIQRHRSENATNNHPCVVLKRADDLDSNPDIRGAKKNKRKRDPQLNGGEDLTIRVSGSGNTSIAFESVPRMKIRAGDLVLVRNRDMVPADLILLASANEGGSAYIETSSIDGETNLKLRNSPNIPKQANMHGLKDSVTSNSSLFNGGLDENGQEDSSTEAESLRQAVKRVANMSLLGHPDGVCALANPENADEGHNLEPSTVKRTPNSHINKILRSLFGDAKKDSADRRRSVPEAGEQVTYIATLTSEPPNMHINNYNGTLTLPPDAEGERSDHAPLSAENILLRGAVLRNTDWVIGLACFTGADTKLVMNSVATPSKFSQLDMLINHTVIFILYIMIICVCSLGAAAVYVNRAAFDQLWYAGYSTDLSEPWPYFNFGSAANIEAPLWEAKMHNFFQNTFMFVTMLSNFIPLSLYVSVELITFMMMFYVGWDKHMYHEESDTPAAARSTIVTDLGLVEYIFSDKTGTLTCNIMEFKRCSVDGHAFGRPLEKAAPQLASIPEQSSEDTDVFSDSVHPLKHLLAGSSPVSGLPQVNETDESENTPSRLGTMTNKLTFNAEMFLRVMSICHTVVVEKDHEESAADSSGKKTDTGRVSLKRWASKLSPRGPRSRHGTEDSNATTGLKPSLKKSKKTEDGAPEGYAYQAESPDEGALVSAASNEYGYQLLGRNSSGVQLSCSCPSLFEDNDVVKGLKDGTVTANMLAAKTASPSGASSKYSATQVETVNDNTSPRFETWPILAINKFDSDRKRMSVLVRSPPELGSVPMLLCKGADSSMMIEGICEGAHMLDSILDKKKSPEAEPESEADNSELNSLLGIHAHLGGKPFHETLCYEYAISCESNLICGELVFHRICIGRVANFSARGEDSLRRGRRAVAYEIQGRIDIDR